MIKKNALFFTLIQSGHYSIGNHFDIMQTCIEHVLVCKEILKMQKNENENELPSYDRIFYGKVKEQMEIARSFSKKIKIIEKIRRSKS